MKVQARSLGWMVSLLSVLMATRTLAEEPTEIVGRSQLPDSAKTVKEWMAQEAEVTSQKSQVKSHKLAQSSQLTQTRVTGVEVKQTPRGLELILKTVAGSERLVPLILPEGND
jgi:hypothetical protein